MIVKAVSLESENRDIPPISLSRSTEGYLVLAQGEGRVTMDWRMAKDLFDFLAQGGVQAQ